MAKTVAASLVHKRIDYANSLIHGSTNIKKLHRVQTSVARVVLPNLSQQPATAILSELHWLPVNSRIIFQLAVSHTNYSPPVNLLICARYYTIDLGVILDSQLSLDAHVASVCRSSYYQLKQLRPVARSLSVEAAKSRHLYPAD